MGHDAQATAIRERLAQRRRRRTLVRLTVIVVLIVFVAGIAGYEYYYKRSLGDGPADVVAHILVVAVEDGALQGAGVLTIDPEGPSARVLEVPAATIIGGERDARLLADVYAAGGVDALRETVGDLLGIAIEHYVQVDFRGFVRVLDRLGGVEVTVRTPIVYRTPEGEELFRLDPGTHRLDGAASLRYLRYRGDDWDGEQLRAERHREWLLAIGRGLAERGSLNMLSDWLDVVSHDVQTDLGAVQITRLAELLWRVGPEAIDYALLPGEAVDGGWVPADGAVATTAKGGSDVDGSGAEVADGQR